MTILLLAGPLFALLIRMSGSSYTYILLVGFTMEIIGFLGFIFLIRKDYIKEGEEISSIKKLGRKPEKEIQ